MDVSSDSSCSYIQALQGIWRSGRPHPGSRSLRWIPAQPRAQDRPACHRPRRPRAQWAACPPTQRASVLRRGASAQSRVAAPQGAVARGDWSPTSSKRMRVNWRSFAGRVARAATRASSRIPPPGSRRTRRRTRREDPSPQSPLQTINRPPPHPPDDTRCQADAQPERLRSPHGRQGPSDPFATG